VVSQTGPPRSNLDGFDPLEKISKVITQTLIPKEKSVQLTQDNSNDFDGHREIQKDALLCCNQFADKRITALFRSKSGATGPF
jgi:hypothetical protein